MIIDINENRHYAVATAPHWVGGFGDPCKLGAEAVRRWSYGFFYALSVMVGALGGRSAACRVQVPGSPTRCTHRPEFGDSGRWFKPQTWSNTMKAQSQVAPIALTISDISIRQDDQGHYCLNDLHKASGGHKNHQPSNWLRTQQTQDLISEIELESGNSDLNTHIRGIKKIGGRYGSTYVLKELVYAYAMWISASFSLKVIRAYDGIQNPQAAQPQLTQDTDLVRILTDRIKSLEGELMPREIAQQPLTGQCLIKTTIHFDSITNVRTELRFEKNELARQLRGQGLLLVEAKQEVRNQRT